MAEYSQIERILRIIQILSSGTRLTTAALMRRFDDRVALRTLQRDLNRIAQAGIPVRSRKTKANENEWFLDHHFRSFIPQTLGLNEYLASHMLRENLKVFRDTNFSKEIDSLIRKIEQIVPENIFIETEDVDAEHIYENYSAGMYDYSSFNTQIESLINAIVNRKRCYIQYYNAYQERYKRFHVEPRRLVYYSGSLYVIVYVRHFKNFLLLAVQRIQKIDVLDKVFPEEPALNPQDFWKGKFGLFSGEAVSVKLKFNKEVLHHIEGRLWHPSQSISRDKEGHLIVDLEVGLTPELISWICSWNEFVQVLNPPELIDQIINKLKKQIKSYKST